MSSALLESYQGFLELYARALPSSSPTASTVKYDVGEGELENTFFIFHFPDSADEGPDAAWTTMSMLRRKPEDTKEDPRVTFRLPVGLATNLWNASREGRRYRTPAQSSVTATCMSGSVTKLSAKDYTALGEIVDKSTKDLDDAVRQRAYLALKSKA
jgi:hypothetical protein